MIHPARIRLLQPSPQPKTTGNYVLYWMQASQRAEYNHALEYAVRRADELKLPVVCVFGLTDGFPEANERHYAFMLQGLAETAAALAERGIRLTVRRGSPEKVAVEAAKNAALAVTDMGYLRVQKQWRSEFVRQARCEVVQVESDVVVPVESASEKEQYAARTLRPRIRRRVEEFLVPLKTAGPRRDSLDLNLPGLDTGDWQTILDELDIDRSVKPVRRFHGGAAHAWKLWDEFCSEKFAGYSDRNDPADAIVSYMSPYLHFGQISPLQIALEAEAAPPGVTKEDKETYLEELIVRRELAINQAHYNLQYDEYDSLPEWARKTLADHAQDPREHLYDREALEQADTHDPYWNAAMREMVHTGYMHNYMRMYWGKKIIEWSAGPREAFYTMLQLNNKYFLDGRDPNSYTNVAWCFGRHDRAWTERPIFGKIRYMNAAGLERKFRIGEYVKQVDGLVEAEQSA